ncbi:hypothetical protein AB1Y20_023332 [Prymnesium parvum]|uniref:Phosphoinositide phospholipase C n=1 Tax=Prymnesium parvum TaxID=97485 RepID=A0AB34JGH6_PRYPA
MDATPHCTDVPNGFGSLELCIGGTSCLHAFSAASSLGDFAFLCAVTVGAFRDYALSAGCPIPFTPSLPASAPLLELCASTCAAAGVRSPGCAPSPDPPPLTPAPPSPPPLPPFAPTPAGTTTVATTAQLRAAIAATPPRNACALFLPAGRRFALGGAPLAVGPISLLLSSSAGGATIDAEGRSQLLDLARGASLTLVALTLANGQADSNGGTFAVGEQTHVHASAVAIVNSSARGSGGAAYLLGGSLTLRACAVLAPSALTFGGFALVGEGRLTLSHGTLVDAPTCARDGGAFYLTGGAVVLSNRSIVRYSSAQTYGGAVGIFARGTLDLSAGSALLHSSAAYGGAIFITGGRVTMSDATISHSHATIDGGAMHLSGGVVVLRGGAVANATAAAAAGAARLFSGSLELLDGALVDGAAAWAGPGGAFVVTGGRLSLVDATVRRVHTDSSGGALELSGGAVSLLRSRVYGASSRVSGGAVSITGGELELNASAVEASRAATDGGGIHQSGGRVSLAAGSHISGCSARVHGGAVYLANGAFSCSDGAFSGCFATRGGGAFLLRGGALRLASARVEACDAPEGALLLVPSNTAGSTPLLLATFTTFAHAACNASLLVAHADARLVLRAVAFVGGAGCNGSALPAAATPGVSSLPCGATYAAAAAAAAEGVCASSAPAACAATRLGASLFSLTCSCPYPEFANPAASSAAAAPYERQGCLQPRRFERLLVVSEGLSLSLHKPDRMTETRNATLVVQGTDFDRPAAWRVSGEAAWLSLPTAGGEVGGREQVEIPIVLSARGLRERAAPYETTLLVHVDSAVASVSHTQPLHVSLLVQARTSSSVWGRARGVCTPPSPAASSRNTTVGVLQRLPFTACDVDGLPVEHQLPAPTDPRRFTASFSAEGAAAAAARVEYVGAGVYEALLTPQSHGAFSVTLSLGAVPRATLSATATCGAERVPMPLGRCGCPAGLFQLAEAGPCEPCPATTTSFVGAVGRDGCDACNPGYYRRAAAHGAECAWCAAVEGVSCAANTTLATLSLAAGRWRHSAATVETWACASAAGWSPCAGGAAAGDGGDGYCAAGYRGPRCELCTAAHHYFDAVSGRCAPCASSATRALVLTAAAAALAALAAAALTRGLGLPRLHAAAAPLALLWGRAGMTCKLKTTLGFAQCVAAVPSVFSVPLPDGLAYLQPVYQLLQLPSRVGRLLSIDSECFGRYTLRLLVSSLWPFPLALLLLLALAAKEVKRARRAADAAAPLGAALRDGGGLLLAATFALVPSISSRIFQTFLCDRFAYDDARDLAARYVHDDLSLSCDSEEYNAAFATGLLLALLFPLGVPLLYAALLHANRRAIRAGVVTTGSHAIRFLHHDYEPHAFFWEPLEMARKVVLTGGVLVIPETMEQGRVLTCLLLSIFFLTLQMIVKPLRAAEDEALTTIVQVVLVLLYLMLLALKSCQISSEACHSFGFGSTGEGIFIFFIFFSLAALCLLITLSIVFLNAARERKRLWHDDGERTHDKVLLALFSNPQLSLSQAKALGLRPLSFGQDIKHLLRSMRISEIAIEPAATLKDAQDAFKTHKPRILVFSGHTVMGSLAFEDTSGRLDEHASPESIGQMLFDGRRSLLAQHVNSHECLALDERAAGEADGLRSPTARLAREIRRRAAWRRARLAPRLPAGAALARLECIVLNGCKTEQIGRHLLGLAAHVTVVCWSTLAEDNAARAFAVGFYEAVQAALEKERQGARRGALRRGGGGEKLAVDSAFRAGCLSFVRQGFAFGDPEEYFHPSGHAHNYRPDFANCPMCTPPVHGECLMLQSLEGEVFVTRASVLMPTHRPMRPSVPIRTRISRSGSKLLKSLPFTGIMRRDGLSISARPTAASDCRTAASSDCSASAQWPVGAPKPAEAEGCAERCEGSEASDTCTLSLPRLRWSASSEFASCPAAAAAPRPSVGWRARLMGRRELPSHLLKEESSESVGTPSRVVPATPVKMGAFL